MPLPAIAPGGEPPDNGPMEARVAKLEDIAQETRDRLARIETRLESYPRLFATKEDLGVFAGQIRAELHDSSGRIRVELHQTITAQTWRFVTWMSGICGALVAATYFIARSVG